MLLEVFKWPAQILIDTREAVRQGYKIHWKVAFKLTSDTLVSYKWNFSHNVATKVILLPF